MKPIKFEGHNIIFGEKQDEYNDLPAFKADNHEGTVIQCWEVSPQDIKTIVETGRIWVAQLTFNKPLQPIVLSVETLLQTQDIKEETET